MDIKNVKEQLANILNKVIEEKIYGSVEIYFEAGQMTQITQRIINKIGQQNKPNPKKVSIYVGFSKRGINAKNTASEKNSDSGSEVSSTSSYKFKELL